MVSAAFDSAQPAAAVSAASGLICQKKIEHEQRDLNRAIARHGHYSQQANEERRELNRLYERCGRRDRDRDRHRDAYRNYYHGRDLIMPREREVDP